MSGRVSSRTGTADIHDSYLILSTVFTFVGLCDISVGLPLLHCGEASAFEKQSNCCSAEHGQEGVGCVTNANRAETSGTK